MTAPTVAADDAAAFAAGTTHTFDLTAGLGTISAGDLLLMFAGSADGVTFTEPSGWTELAEYHTANAAEAAVFYLIAAGGETSAAFDISASETAAAIVWRITGHDAADPPATSVAVQGGSINPDSGLCTPGTTEDFLYISAFFTRGSNTISVYPYGDGNITVAGTLATVGGAWVQTSGSSSEDPGAYTKSGTQDWIAVTLGIFPGAAAAAGVGVTPIIQNYRNMGLMG